MVDQMFYIQANMSFEWFKPREESCHFIQDKDAFHFVARQWQHGVYMHLYFLKRRLTH